MEIKIVIDKLIMLLSVMIIGYISRKKNILSDELNKGFSILIVNITLPCMIIASMLVPQANVSKKSVITLVITGTLVYSALALIAIIIPKIFKATILQDGIYRFCTLLNNNIFMGFPIISSILGATGVFYGALLNIPGSLFMFSLGVYYMTKHKDGGKFHFKQLLTIGTITSIVCTLLYFVGYSLPPVLLEAFSSVGNITVPLSMIVLGSSLAIIPVKSIFSEFKLYIFAIFKMVLIPIFAFILLSRVSIIDKTILYVIIISLSMPGPTLSVSLALDYDADVSFASKYVFLSTVLSVATIPFVLKLLL